MKIKSSIEKKFKRIVSFEILGFTKSEMFVIIIHKIVWLK